MTSVPPGPPVVEVDRSLELCLPVSFLSRFVSPSGVDTAPLPDLSSQRTFLKSERVRRRGTVESSEVTWRSVTVDGRERRTPEGDFGLHDPESRWGGTSWVLVVEGLDYGWSGRGSEGPPSETPVAGRTVGSPRPPLMCGRSERLGELHEDLE